MASQSSDRLLWVLLGASLFFAFRGIAADLQRVRRLAEIKKAEKEDQIIGEATEDALKLDTLQRLSESSNFDLRAAALRIVSERATKDTTRDLLLQDLACHDPTRRRKAVNAVHFLVSSRALTRSTASSRLKDTATFTALVDCLCHYLQEHKDDNNRTTESPILPRTRPPGENKALSTLSTLLPENIPAALEAGVIHRWLAKYPFPCTLHDESSRSKIVKLMKTWSGDDPVMSTIVTTLARDHYGARQLRRYGLMGSMLEENTSDMYNDFSNYVDFNNENPGYHDSDSDDDGSDSDAWMVDGADTAGALPWLERRRQEASAEEQALRRRRREAMVLSEGGRPLGRDNIIEPVRSDEQYEDYMESSDELLEREDRDTAAGTEPEDNSDTEQQRMQWRLWPFF